jgi:hypothetical protein
MLFAQPASAINQQLGFAPIHNKAFDVLPCALIAAAR